MRARKLASLIGVAALCLLLASSRGMPLPSIEKRWSIGIYAGSTPLTLETAGAAANPVLTASEVRDVPARFVADPFLVRDGPIWHLFFEVFNADTEQGDIGWATSEDGWRWTYQRIVLDEPFHLSYPYVFRDGHDYYMVPESSTHGSIRLYRADPFPDRWTFVADLVTGTGLVDASVIHYDGRWWMFAGTDGHQLNVYYARQPEGPWTPHAANPVVRGAPDHARPGGRLVTWDDHLFRFAQDDSVTYGLSVSAYEITSLATDRYTERPVVGAKLAASGSGWNAAGMHHVDPVAIAPQRWIAAVDGNERALMFGFRRLRLRLRPRLWPVRDEP